MAVRGGEDAYVTLLLSDNYLPGALVLAHSLRDAGTTKKLAVMVTLESVAAEVITQLKAVYDYVIPVSTIRNDRPANLYLMNRPDLHSAFTKVNLWKQTQFRKIVYIDADVVAYRAPDELFALEHAFSAAPDIGWPDLFNSGVMALTPNMGDYYALMAMAERGISFDGADQGLLNMHFKHSYNRLSFTYNVTPSAHYQYVPAYRHFQSSINMVHFIGAEKPWLQGRSASSGSGPFDEMVGRWWAVYDRHYRENSVSAASTQRPPAIVQYFVKGEYQPKVSFIVPTRAPAEQSTHSQPQHHEHHEHHQHQEQYEHHEHHEQPEHQQQQPHGQGHHNQHFTQPHFQHPPRTHSEHHHYQPPGEAREHYHHDDQDGHHDHHDSHQHSYQPPSSGHHHISHHIPPHHHYISPAQHSETPQFEGSSAPASASVQPWNSSSFSAFAASFSDSKEPDTEAPQDQVQGHRAPPHEERKPEPEKPQPPPMEPSWDAQRQPPPPESKPEALNFPQMHYEMSSDTAPFVPPERYPSPPKNMWYEVPTERPAPPQQKPPAIFPWEQNKPQPSRVFNDPPPPPPAESEWSDAAPSGQGQHGVAAEASLTGSSAAGQQTNEPDIATIPTMPPVTVTSDPWATFTLTNAWDDMPEIERYVGALQKHRRGKVAGKGPGLRLGGSTLSGEGDEGPAIRPGGDSKRGLKLTDFPSEFERPSLPVTPAPVRRPNFWGGGDPEHSGVGGGSGGDQLLPAAHGVPQQSDWDPVAQLQKLAKQQSELLLQRLGGDDAELEEDQQSRPTTTVGSEGSKSPKYVTHSSTVLSPKPVKPTGAGRSPVQSILGDGAGSEDEAVPRSVSGPRFGSASTIQESSFRGSGASWEKGEDAPLK